VRVAPLGAGKQVDLQLYDPALVNTGQDCNLLPDVSDFATNGNANPYVKNTEARQRYVHSNTRSDGSTFSDGSSEADGYCTGDSYAGVGSNTTAPHALTTSFVLRKQTDSQNPSAADVQNDTSGKPCIKQYGSVTTTRSRVSGGFTAFSGISQNLFKSGQTGYNVDVASTFHNWSSLCTFTPPVAGDYYLHVRTNVAMGGTALSSANLIKTGNTAAAAKTGNTTSGEGTNSFAIRAVTGAGYEQHVSVSGYNHMPIYVNADTASAEFHLIRVLPGAAGQKISFSYFDAGDSASSTGSVKVLRPADAKGTIVSTPFPGGCTAYGGSAGGSDSAQTVLTACTAPFVKSGSTSKNNGQTETITIPIPTDYTCDFNLPSGCWYKVVVTFGSGDVHDVTTWDATVIGDPVRLIE